MTNAFTHQTGDSMGSRLLRVSLALILPSAASDALVEGSGGIGRAGTYPS
jgi:hypothetical protein